MTSDLHPMLRKILDAKVLEVASLARRVSRADLELAVDDAPEPRDFIAALRNAPGPAVIAEIKRCSPSAGELRPEADPAAIAVSYQQAGAAALSVLTDGPFFGGSLQDLQTARAACALPVLRKDFIIDELQVLEARAAGADAVLLIAAALEASRLAQLHALAISLGLAVLVEVHAASELDSVLTMGPKLVGINNRNLGDFSVDVDTSLRLRPMIPPAVTVVAESGISNPDQIARLSQAGLDAFLIGSALMQSPDPGQALAGIIQTEVAA